MTIARVIFSAAPLPLSRRRGLVLSSLLALATHGTLFVVLGRAAPVPPPPPPRQHGPIVFEGFVEPRAPAPPRPPPPSKARGASKGVARPSLPARAGPLVAPLAPPNAPATEPVVITGSEGAYVGGVSASNATAPEVGSPLPDASSPVRLAEEEWHCAWPAEADAAQVDEQFVLLRVRVDAHGDPLDVRVESEPGYGFGPAARTCALRTHFVPARDRNGNALAATSGAIRVRFTR